MRHPLEFWEPRGVVYLMSRSIESYYRRVHGWIAGAARGSRLVQLTVDVGVNVLLVIIARPSSSSADSLFFHTQSRGVWGYLHESATGFPWHLRHGTRSSCHWSRWLNLRCSLFCFPVPLVPSAPAGCPHNWSSL